MGIFFYFADENYHFIPHLILLELLSAWPIDFLTGIRFQSGIERPFGLNMCDYGRIVYRTLWKDF